MPTFFLFLRPLLCIRTNLLSARIRICAINKPLGFKRSFNVHVVQHTACHCAMYTLCSTLLVIVHVVQHTAFHCAHCSVHCLSLCTLCSTLLVIVHVVQPTACLSHCCPPLYNKLLAPPPVSSPQSSSVF